MVDYFAETEDSPEADEHHAISDVASSAVWVSALLVAGGACLVSRNILAGALFPVLVKAQPSFRAAAWVRRSDPRGDRGKVCSRFLYATGCWNALLSGIVALVALAAVSLAVGTDPETFHIATTVSAIGIATALTSLIGIWAVATTWRHRVRVWAHPKLLQLADYDFANLRNLRLHPPACNHAIYVSAISLAFPAMAAGTTWMMLAASSAPPNEQDVVPILGGFTLLLGGPVISIVTLILFSSRLFAEGPAECWSDSNSAPDTSSNE